MSSVSHKPHIISGKLKGRFPILIAANSDTAHIDADNAWRVMFEVHHGPVIHTFDALSKAIHYYEVINA